MIYLFYKMKKEAEKVKTKQECKSFDGVEVYSYPNPCSHSFQLSLFLRCGSMHEDADKSGISHFFEHIAIRNVNKLMNGELYAALDEKGVEFNASTYSEMIQFYVSGALKNFRFAAEVLMKILSPIVLDATEISAERRRIKAEIRESDERTSLTSFTNEKVHGSTALSRSITGTAGSVDKIGKGALENFRENNTVRENIFFYATGNVTKSDIDFLGELISRTELKSGKKCESIAPVSNYFGKRVPQIHIKNADFTMVRFTFDLDMKKISIAEADLIYDILLGGYNSEFFIELSERRGYFYDISGALERYLNIATLSFSFEVKGAVLYESVREVVRILSKMKTELLPEEKCMRAAYVDNAYMLLDDARELGFTFAYDNCIMNAAYADIDQRVAAYSSITPERIRELSAMIFKTQNLTFTMKGQAKRVCADKLLSSLTELE